MNTQKKSMRAGLCATWLLVTLLGAVAASGQTGQRAPIRLIYPNGLALDAQGNLYSADIGTHRILKLDRQRRLIVVADPGESGFSGDGGPAAKAKIFSSTDLKLDAAGNLYIVDSGNHRVRVVREGVIMTIVGAGRAGLSGDGQSATAAALHTPQKKLPL